MSPLPNPWPGLELHKWPASDRYPKHGQVLKGEVQAVSIPWPERAYLELRLDPKRNSKVRSKSVSAEVIETADHPKAKKRLFNTPRWGKTDACRTLTVRSERDLPTTV